MFSHRVSRRLFTARVATAGLTTLALLALGGTAPAYAAPPEYTITDLGVLPGGTVSAGRAIGYYAVVAGKADDGTGHEQAFYRMPGGSPLLIPPLPGVTVCPDRSGG